MQRYIDRLLENQDTRECIHVAYSDRHLTEANAMTIQKQSRNSRALNEISDFYSSVGLDRAITCD